MAKAAQPQNDKAVDNDKLANFRGKVADLISEMSDYKDTAGSTEIAQVQTSLAYLGRAFNLLMPNTPDVPSVYGYY